jgi:hypothetical protein
MGADGRREALVHSHSMMAVVKKGRQLAAPRRSLPERVRR